MTSTLVQGAAGIFTGLPGAAMRATGAIRIVDGRIAAVGSLEREPGEQVIDASGCVVYPGLVSTHQVSGCGRTQSTSAAAHPCGCVHGSRKELYCNRRLSGAISRPRTATSGVRSDEGTEGIHEVNDVGARSREAERGYSASRAV